MRKTCGGGHKQGDLSSFKLCRIPSDDDMAILTAQIFVKNATGQQIVLVGANSPASMATLLVGANGCAIVQILAPCRFRDI